MEERATYGRRICSSALLLAAVLLHPLFCGFPPCTAAGAIPAPTPVAPVLPSSCNASVCVNEGTCVEGDGEVVCICPSDYTGLYCEIPAVTLSCPSDGAGGLLWETDTPGVPVTRPCRSFDPRLSGGNVTRVCLFQEIDFVWDEIDTRLCIFKESTNAFLNVWLTLINVDSQEDLEASAGELVDEIAGYLNVPSGLIFFKPPVPLGVTSYTVTFEVAFNTILPADSVEQQFLSSFQSLIEEASTLGGYDILVDQSGYKGLQSTNSCSCDDGSTGIFTDVCIGISFAPACNCISSQCVCNQPFYTGEGGRCTLDREGDGFPNNPLDTCVEGDSILPDYCKRDVCPDIFDSTQDPNACALSIPGFTGCKYGRDPSWNIAWANTLTGAEDTQRCPASTSFATRLCGETGWEQADVSQCQSSTFANYEDMAESIFDDSNTDLETLLEETSQITSDLSQLTESATGASLLPEDLEATNEIVAGVIGLLENTLNNSNISQVPPQHLLNIFNNVLNGSNLVGWTTLQEGGEVGSQLVLDSAERYSLYLANAVENDEEGLRISQRSNIVIGFGRFDPTTERTMTFPSSLEQIADSAYQRIPAQITIPPTVLQQRMRNGDNVSVSTAIFRTMASVLPRMEKANFTATIPTVVLSAQVGERGSGVELNEMTMLDEPVDLEFTFDSVENASDYKCIFWRFSEPIGNGAWNGTGLEMVGQSVSGNQTTIRCRTQHLSSFAVLVIVSDGTIDDQLALQIVSYIGLALSIACLIVSVIFLLTLGKDLLSKVHYFIHLNLAVALLIGYIVFAIGIELGARNQGGCIFVTVLLHYFFLASFSWMLCEGIMLYLMLVVVFSRLSKKWWFFLLLGWGLPVIPVVVSVAARHSFYGVRDDEGNLLYCWLSTDQGVIWAFVGPMLAIILVNVIFLVVALVKVFQTTRSKAERTESDKNIVLFKALFKGTIILLPILGLTWVLGIFAVNQNTLVFAWLFTIFNTLQGVFIFLFHVLRSEKVWNSARMQRYKSKASSTFRSSFNSSTLKKQYTVSEANKSTMRSTTSSYAKQDSGVQLSGDFSSSTVEDAMKLSPIGEFSPDQEEVDSKPSPPTGTHNHALPNTEDSLDAKPDSPHDKPKN